MWDAEGSVQSKHSNAVLSIFLLCALLVALSCSLRRRPSSPQTAAQLSVVTQASFHLLVFTFG